MTNPPHHIPHYVWIISVISFSLIQPSIRVVVYLGSNIHQTNLFDANEVFTFGFSLLTSTFIVFYKLQRSIYTYILLGILPILFTNNILIYHQIVYEKASSNINLFLIVFILVLNILYTFAVFAVDYKEEQKEQEQKENEE